jgi:hypothetical protein
MSVTTCDVGSGVAVGDEVVVGFVVGVVVGEELVFGDVVGFDVGLVAGLAVGVEVALGAVDSCGMEKYATVPTEATMIIMQSIAITEVFMVYCLLAPFSF